MNAKNKQYGFAILEILLLVVTLSFIVAIAWVVMHHSKDVSNKKSAKTDQGNFIELAEWKVKITLPDKTQKISYKVVDGNPNSIILSSEALDKFAADHKECSSANQYVTIARTKVGQPFNGTAWEQAKPQLEKNGSKSLGLFYYFNGARPSVSPCIGTNIAEIQALNNQAYDLYDLLPSYNNVVINP
jgi:type II secretory pathway pseudopilin PulG